MSKIRFKIDEKSLFYGMHNDYERGQTATVSTPINQSKDKNKWHQDIIEFLNCGLEMREVPRRLEDICLKRTTSQAKSELVNVFVFDKICFNGISLATNSSFAIYAKKEIDKHIKKRDGTKTENTHLGRIKLHYPITLKYMSNDLRINNQEVLDHILLQNGNFAYVVRGFEVDVDNRELNFLMSLVGVKNIPLSSVFRRKKGIGKKLLLEELDPDLIEEVTMSLTENTQIVTRKIKNDSPSNYEELLDKINESRRENGKKGEKYVMENINNILRGRNIEDVYHTSAFYPTSPYDIEYIENGIKKYLEVKATSDSRKVFNMSKSEYKFMNEYDDLYTLVLLTNINSDFPNIHLYKKRSILKMKKDYPKIVFTAI